MDRPLNVSPARPDAQILSPVNSNISVGSHPTLATASPKESPTNSGILTSTTDAVTTISDEEDRNNNNQNSSDENCENDTISVTGSPTHSSVDIEEDRKSPQTSGAFTAFIQRNRSSNWASFKKYGPDLNQLPHPNQAFNQALAAQLFLQNPLIPQSSQWLYNQLYGNQQDLSWFRHSLLTNQTGTTVSAGANVKTVPVNGATGGNVDGDTDNNTVVNNNGGVGVNLTNKGTVSSDDDDLRKSPPVTSTKRSPSPEGDSLRSGKYRKRSNSLEVSDDNSLKHTDVWRPY